MTKSMFVLGFARVKSSLQIMLGENSSHISSKIIALGSVIFTFALRIISTKQALITHSFGK